MRKQEVGTQIEIRSGDDLSSSGMRTTECETGIGLLTLEHPMNTRNRRGFVAAGLSVVIGGLATRTLAQNDSTPSASPQASPEASPSASPAASSGTELTIEAFRFLPQVLEIPVGTTLTWTNLDIIPHNITADAGSFGSENLTRDQTFSYTFEQAGTFTYVCTLHLSMTGTVTVV